MELLPFVSKGNGFPERDEELEDRLTSYYDHLPDLRYEGHTGEIDNYLTALEQGTRPMITGEDGRRTIELITAIYKSGAMGQTVALPISPEDDFYTFQGLLAHVPHFYEKTGNVENFAPDEITVGNYQEKQ